MLRPNIPFVHGGQIQNKTVFRKPLEGKSWSGYRHVDFRRVTTPLGGFEFSGAGPFGLQGSGFRVNFLQIATLQSLQNTDGITSGTGFWSGGQFEDRARVNRGVT